MIVLDTEQQARRVRARQVEAQRDRVRAWTAANLEANRVIDDPERSPLSLEHQLGRPLFTREFEDLALRINPDLHFTWSRNPRIKHMWLKLSDGGLKLISAYENGVIPERSLMEPRYINTPPDHFDEDRAVNYGEAARQVLNRVLNTPRFHRGPVTYADQDAVYEMFADALDERQAAYVPYRRLVAGPEKIRGWRGLLVRLVQCGAASTERVERVVGAMNDPNWRALLGKGGRPTW